MFILEPGLPQCDVCGKSARRMSGTEGRDWEGQHTCIWWWGGECGACVLRLAAAGGGTGVELWDAKQCRRQRGTCFISRVCYSVVCSCVSTGVLAMRSDVWGRARAQHAKDGSRCRLAHL